MFLTFKFYGAKITEMLLKIDILHLGVYSVINILCLCLVSCVFHDDFSPLWGFQWYLAIMATQFEN